MASSPSSSTSLQMGGSGLGQYSPISTLERQYATKTLQLFVKANAACCIDGGVQGILQRKRTTSSAANATLVNGGMNGTASATASPTEASTATTAASTAMASTEALCGDGTFDDDPFSFLSEDASPPSSTNDMSSSTTSNPRSSGGGVGRFLKSVAKSTTKTLERQMHSLAIRADQGKNQDLLVVGLYDERNALLCMTESQTLPMDANDGVSFSVPLVLSSRQSQSTVLTIKLWIRSGAALLQQTKAAKNLLIGSTQVDVGNVEKMLQNQQPHGTAGAPTVATYFDVTLQSALVANGQLSICAVSDWKHPPLCGRGWSLADPAVPSYATPQQQQQPQANTLHNLPLDQSYSLAFPQKPQSYLIGTERTVESTLVLPIASAFAKLAVPAAQSSLALAQAAAARLQERKIDSTVGQYAECNVNIHGISIQDASVAGTQQQPPLLSASWQRPDAIFEVSLTQPQHVPITSVSPTHASAAAAAASFRFFPKPCRNNALPSLLQAHGGRMPATGFMLGNVILRVSLPSNNKNRSSNNNRSNLTPSNPFDSLPNDISATAGGGDDVVFDCLIGLEALVMQPPPAGAVLEYPLLDSSNRKVGSVAVAISVQMKQGDPIPAPATRPKAEDGLVSLVGLPQLCQSVQPSIDYDYVPPQQSDAEGQRRHHQLVTMGDVVSYAYLDQHNRRFRSRDCTLIEERAKAYQEALTQQPTGEKLPPHQDRSPKPFRPSSSRMEVVLSGLPFNVHTASFSLNVMDPGAPAQPRGDVFCNTTCGAPADHARGFSNVFAARKDQDGQAIGLNSPVGPVSGGLRRLEAKRQELADRVTKLQNHILAKIGEYFVAERQSGQKIVTHVPANQTELQNVKMRLCEAVQTLHHVTWICAARRANSFSQALGIATTTYLASMSDPSKWQSTWPDLWARHGYLVSFEGLLSAAGKELGMIEDASVGISMLRMVQIVFMRDDGAPSATRTGVPGSPYVKWVDLRTFGQNGERQFSLQIGILPSYFDQRIPPSLRNGTRVRLFSLLFEVGVDIRQWGANAGSNVMTQFSGDKQSSEASAPAGLIDDEDGADEPDDVGVRDDDVLVQLNYEAFQSLNTYAHLISPANSQQTMEANKTHPLLEKLFQHIVSSAGKMNHSILDEAAALARQLGGGGAIFCKSGKDRTAMHVTFKQAQFANRFREQHPSDDGAPVLNRTLEDATVIRIHGTRLPICEKNVGQAKYAFNSLQVKFMPDALKPPMNTLAGFLKGGAVFKGGGIES